MADEALVAEIKTWSPYTPTNEKRLGADLRGAHLMGANLRGAHLMGADLSEADLRAADLREADLSNANLHQADLMSADLCDAYLSRADLTGADLTSAELSNANLHQADIRGANLSYAMLSEADLSYTLLSAAVLDYAYLLGTDLSNANLRNTHFHETVLVNTSLAGVKDLETCQHFGRSTIDHRTYERSGGLPNVFLRGCGLPDSLIEYFPSLLNQPISFYSCFISYSHADKSFARRLHDQLQGQGIRCWLDEHQILPGDDIHKEIDRGLRLWDKVLLCASENSLTSWWVDNEINSALKKEQRLMKERGQNILALIPLNLDNHMFDSTDWGDGKADQVTKRHAADFTGWETNNDKFESAFEKVVLALREDGGRKKPPPQKL